MYTISYIPYLDRSSSIYLYVWCMRQEPPSELKRFLSRQTFSALSPYKGMPPIPSTFSSSNMNSCIWIFKNPEQNQFLSMYEDIAFIYSILEQHAFSISFPLSNLIMSDHNRSKRITNIFFHKTL